MRTSYQRGVVPRHSGEAMTTGVCRVYNRPHNVLSVDSIGQNILMCLKVHQIRHCSKDFQLQ
uniref:Uncharacterized protein n=1 Tax=Physcomitrium patens TaxID=3218 RepID=A0A2K1JYN7_PHYPA|nr:hypothetical protein PHYPA_013757 [Physcomitrium patens]